MKDRKHRIIHLACILAACAVQTSCSLSPEPGWAPSPPPERPNTVAPWKENWPTHTR